MTFTEIAPWLALAATIMIALWVDMAIFDRGGGTTFRQAVAWAIGWLAFSLAAALVLWLLAGRHDAVVFTTVYLIERTLSLDNLFVFLVLFGYFGIPAAHRRRLLFWGIMAAIVLRGIAIYAGVAALHAAEPLIYVLAALLIVLAYRIFRGAGEPVDPAHNPVLRLVERFFPVAEGEDRYRWVVRRDGRLHATPLSLCLVAVVVADIVFAIDSIPAALAITRESFLIWMANAFALMGLRSLFMLVDYLIERFRYLDETIAVVLGIVGAKILIQDFVKISPVASLAIIVVAFATGIAVSLVVERREAGSPGGRAGG